MRGLLLFLSRSWPGFAGAFALTAVATHAAPPPPIPELAPHWRFVDLPSFEVLSSCNEERTRYYIECIYRSIPLMELPLNFSQTGQKIRIILCDHPLDRTFAPAGAPKALRDFGKISSITYAECDDMETMLLRVSLARWDGKAPGWNVTGLPLHLVPFLVDHHLPQPPEWLRAAVETIYGDGDATITGDTLSWPGLPRIKRELRDARDRPENLRPLQDLLSEAPPPPDPKALARWKAEAALFVHAVSFGPSGHPREFWTFCEQASLAPVTEQMFRDCLHTRFSAVREIMSRHIAEGLDASVGLYGARLARKPRLEMRDATVGEVCRIEGEWELMFAEKLKVSHPPLSAAFLARASATLHHAYATGDHDARLLAALGLCARAAGDPQRAREFFEHCLANADIRPRALRELAQIRLDAARAVPQGANGKLSRAQTAEILAPLTAALAQQPAPATYQLLVETWEASEQSPTREDFKLVREILDYFPRERALVTRAAALAKRVKLDDEAALLLRARDQFVAAEHTR